jgi:hypothetical protein
MKRFLILLALVAIGVACSQNPNTGSVHVADSTHQKESQPFGATNIQKDGELPAKQSIPALFDEMDYQQAVQCYLWALPMVEIEIMTEMLSTAIRTTHYTCHRMPLFRNTGPPRSMIAQRMVSSEMSLMQVVLLRVPIFKKMRMAR